MNFQWWGYMHVSGKLIAKRYWDDSKVLDDAYESPFVTRVFMPFPADSQEDAIEFIKKLKEKK